MNLGGKCGMFFLIAINGLFFALGLGLLIVGILLKVDVSAINKEQIVTALNEVNLGGSLKFGSMAQSLPILLICSGVFVLLIAGLGMFGACCKNRCMLVTYAIIVLLILILQVVVVVLFFIMKGKWEDVVQTNLEKSFNKYEGPTSTNEVSVGWDLMFIGLDCCGVNEKYAANPFQYTQWKTSGSGSGSTQKVPYSCCKAATEDNYKNESDQACTDNLDETKYNSKDCYTAVKDYIEKYQNAAIGIGIALLLIEIIGAAFAFVLCRAIGKDDMVV